MEIKKENKIMKNKMIMTVLAVENLKKSRDFYKEIFNFAENTGK